jgi:hypothetical protein
MEVTKEGSIFSVALMLIVNLWIDIDHGNRTPWYTMNWYTYIVLNKH